VSPSRFPLIRACVPQDADYLRDGKLKGELLRKMYGSDSIAAMGRLSELFNPGRRLNRGNMLP
jgi:hypothetical protein